MSGRNRAVAVLAAASLLSGCSTGAPLTTASPTADPPAAAAASNGLRYSTARADAVEAMPAPGTCHYQGSGLFAQPDPRCAPGALNPNVTQANIHQTICRPDYSASIRPPEAVTEEEKRALMAAYGNHAPLSSVELDHIVGVSEGGAVNSVANLWPEPNYGHISPRSYFENPKDRLELRLYQLTCRGRIRLSRAQGLLAYDWPAAYRTYVLR